ncbi:hypothetical protein TSAR_016431 [Trichomalopsis sarcophagae]|uniref:Uncharacterized protein n=1 Tax=Trichomalopsis sarcophagae TaxID=543379 RepID=A0A232EVV1_9HYME|nr:hypothetical protein TSAR_016431 [Trichomalopsis sarcophagae]
MMLPFMAIFLLEPHFLGRTAKGLLSSEATTLRTSPLRGDQATKQDLSCFSLGLTFYQFARLRVRKSRSRNDSLNHRV